MSALMPAPPPPEERPRQARPPGDARGDARQLHVRDDRGDSPLTGNPQITQMTTDGRGGGQGSTQAPCPSVKPQGCPSVPSVGCVSSVHRWSSAGGEERA